MSFKTYTLEEIIQCARERSPYYAELYKDLPADTPFEKLPLISLDDFWKHCDAQGGTVATFKQTDGQVFKSGGSTGDPKYSLYTAEEWATMCECSGAVLGKGGLENGAKVANLFYAGGLYASFLYTYSMLYFAPAKTIMYNLAGNISIEEMVKTIHDHKINCLAGLPSILTKIGAYVRENNLTDFHIDTIYFAGETLYPDQREMLKKIFGEHLSFRSVFYASNDGGPIGYFTKDCGYNEHRVLSDLTYLELIDPDTGEVITEMNRPGVIYVTSLFKTLIPLIRYPAGDMGEYTEPEGVPDRKFRILGRNDLVARAGYVTVYPQDIGIILNKCDIPYYAYQVISTHNIMDQYIFRIAGSKENEKYNETILELLYKERPTLLDAINAGDLEVPIVEWCDASELEYNPRTGKLKTVIDARK